MSLFKVNLPRIESIVLGSVTETLGKKGCFKLRSFLVRESVSLQLPMKYIQCCSQKFFPASKVGDLYGPAHCIPLATEIVSLLFDLNKLLMKEGPKIHNTTFL